MYASETGAGQGVWKVLFDAVADVHHAYTVKAVLKSRAPVVLSNVLFGDVWICSGQSNMKFPVEQVFRIYRQNCRLKTVNSSLISLYHIICIKICIALSGF